MVDPNISSLVDPATLANFKLAATAAAALGLALWLGRVGKQRLELSVAKHPSLTGHSRWAKRLTRWIPGVEIGRAHV